MDPNIKIGLDVGEDDTDGAETYMPSCTLYDFNYDLVITFSIGTTPIFFAFTKS